MAFSFVLAVVFAVVGYVNGQCHSAGSAFAMIAYIRCNV
jgi:hypothetical protein